MSKTKRSKKRSPTLGFSPKPQKRRALDAIKETKELEFGELDTSNTRKRGDDRASDFRGSNQALPGQAADRCRSDSCRQDPRSRTGP